MRVNDFLSVSRLVRLTTNEMKQHLKGFWFILLTLTLYYALGFHNPQSLSTFYFILYVGGIIVSATAFKELHNPHKAYLNLTLPCSNVERFLVKWLITSVGYILFSFILYVVSDVLASFIQYILWKSEFRVLNIFDSELLISFKNYLVIQTVFLLGGITFKRYAIFKTILVLGLIFLFYLALIGLMTLYMYSPDSVLRKILPFLFQLFQLSHSVFWLVAPFCLLVTYLKMTEVEVK